MAAKLKPEKRVARTVATTVVLVVALLARILRAVMEPAINPDAIRFIEQAKLLFSDPLKALRGETYHPLHSLLVRLVHDLVTAHVAGDDRFAWVAATKVVGIVAGTGVCWLIMRISRHFGASWWAAAGAGLLWAVGRRSSSYGADGLSDMLFLFFFGWAMLAAIKGRMRPGFWRWAGVGALAGLAYLTRPEGAAVILILGMTLVIMSLRQRLRRTLLTALTPRRFAPLRSVVYMLVGFVLVGGPYMVAIGRFTGKKEITLEMPGPPPGGNGAVLAQMGAVLPEAGHIGLRLCVEIWETFGFAPCLVVGLAMLIKPRLWGRRQWQPLVLVWVIFWIGTMIWLIHRTQTADNPEGYLDGRHTLVLEFALHCVFALAVDIWMLPMKWWQDFWRRRAVWQRLPAWQRYPGWPRIFAVIVLALGCLPGAIMLREAPSQDRQFLRDAAVWIDANTATDAVIAFREPTLSFYANRGYSDWFGKNTEVELEHQRNTNKYKERLLIACIFQTDKGEMPPAELGGCRLVKTFDSPTSLHHDVLAFYLPVLSRAMATGP